MKRVLLLLAMLATMFVQAQKKFQKGFYIDNQNVRHECFIKNVDWFIYPKFIDIKKDSLTDEIKTIEIQHMITFEIYNKLRYKRFKNAEIFNPVFLDNYALQANEYVMLKEIVTGNPSLFSLQDKRKYYFYTTVEKQTPIYLEYIDGFEPKNNEYKINENYKFTLNNKFSSNNEECRKRIEKLKYFDEEMIAFFNYLNKSENENFIVNEKKNQETKSKLNLIARVGYRMSSYKYTYINYINNSVMINDEFNNTAPRFGFLIGFRPNFSNSKLMIFADVNYSKEKFNANGEGGRKYNVEFSHVQVPLGLSYSLFRNEDSDLYLSSALVLDIINKKSFVEVNTLNVDGNMGTGLNFEVGLGYSYKRFSLDIKNGLKKTLTPGKSTNFQHNYLDFVLGYKLF